MITDALGQHLLPADCFMKIFSNLRLYANANKFTSLIFVHKALH